MPKITALPNTTIPATDDLLPFVDVSGTPTTRKATVANLAASTAFTGQYAPLAEPVAAAHIADAEAAHDATAIAVGDVFNSDFSVSNVSAALVELDDKIELVEQYARAGSGAPNGVVTGSVGDRYIDTAATLGARVWYKASGAATNTGWLVAEGDTGWRDVTANLTNGWTMNASGKLLIRRVGQHVELITDVTQAVGTAASSNALYTVPDGFRCRGYQHSLAGLSSDSTLGTIRVNGVSGNTVNLLTPAYASQVVVRINCRWLTTNAWPSSLPGSAA